ncbi:MAG TPA: hypothetical protein VFE58_06465 [Tepidisphaeraceae bacterium]|jgi:Zn-finger nucleic acid-binding protein|nr:hypothetical protein [Tepidisphaeraceae bacterium]
MTNYSVSRGGLGKAKVSYHCPACNDDLKSPIEDAGNKDRCPTCNAELIVPGEAELLRLHTERERLEQEAKAKRELEDARSQDKTRAAKDKSDKPLLYHGPALIYAEPDAYAGIVTSAKVLRGAAIFCFVLGILLLTGAAALLLVASISKIWALLLPSLSCLAGGTVYLIIGALINMFASLSSAIRDIAIQTHPTIVARVLQTNSPSSSLPAPSAPILAPRPSFPTSHS